MGQDTLRCTSQQKNFLGFISSAFSTTPGREGHYLPFVPDARHPLKRRNMPVISRKLPVVDILTNNDNNLRCLYNRPIFLRLLQVRSKVCIAEPLRIAEAAFLMPGCPVCLFLRFNSHLPGEPGLASVHWSKGWWWWWWQLDSCKAPVKSSPPTNQHPVFYGPDALPVTNQQCQCTEGKISHSMNLLTPSHLGVFQLCLCH